MHYSLSLITLFASTAIFAAQPNIADTARPYSPAEKMPAALNGTMFPPSPDVPAAQWANEPEGFATERLYSTPEPGVHPRIVFGPKDLDRVRAHFKGVKVAAIMLDAIREGVAKGIDNSKTLEGQYFAALAAGDLTGFKALVNSGSTAEGSADFKKLFDDKRKPGFTWGWGAGNPLLRPMEMKALLCLLDKDDKGSRKVAAALCTWADFIRPQVEAANRDPNNANHWNGMRDLVSGDIGFTYDWTADVMTTGQRDTVRRLLADAIKGKYTLGWDLPSHWRTWNFIGIDAHVLVNNLAIEGEEGHVPQITDRAYENARDYLTYGNSPVGGGKEGVGYQTSGQSHLVIQMLALANRGRNLWTHNHLRRQVDSWLVEIMNPYGGGFMANGDLANGAPALSLVMSLKYFYPRNAATDYVLQNTQEAKLDQWKKAGLYLDVGLLLMCADPSTTDHQFGADFGRKLTWFDPDRGVLVARTAWAHDAVVLHVDCRNDTTFPSHDHPDRGQFVLFAHGRPWACDGFRDSEPKYHNTVTIDGYGQGYFPTPGRWVALAQNDQAVMALVDLKYPYDWFWPHTPWVESEEMLKRRGMEDYIPVMKRVLSRFPLEKFELDPLPGVRRFFAGYDAMDPRLWGKEDNATLRAPWNPVERATRISGLFRGKHPYVLVCDDMKKDDQERLYEWRMNMPPDIDVVSLKGNELLLGDQTTKRTPYTERDELFQSGFLRNRTALTPASGDRLLLVRVLDRGEPRLPALQENIRLQLVEYLKFDDSHQFLGRSNGLGKQVVVPARSTATHTRVLLFPHKSGEELPVSSWNESKTVLTVSWKDQVDVITFQPRADGIEGITVIRDGALIVDLVSPKSMTTAAAGPLDGR